MALDPPPPPADVSEGSRYAPHATREMAGMFDDVSGRYDLLNRVMSLGQDRAWRIAMSRAVPTGARAVLDLCCGSGTSLDGLRSPGRLVLGVDVSHAMLRLAVERHGTAGWAPRLICADGFRLPLPDGRLDAITIAFGIRNLRPTRAALAELARVLRPAGTLVVLEATAPRSGLLAPFHAFYLRRLIPLAGRWSPDPSAYRYLSDSIFEFGDGARFESDLSASGFEPVARRRFMLGATALWVARRLPPDGRPASDAPARSQFARSRAPLENSAQPADDAEWKVWNGAQAVLSGILALALGYALWFLAQSGGGLPWAGWHRRLAQWLLVAGAVVFGVRFTILLARALGPRSRR